MQIIIETIKNTVESESDYKEKVEKQLINYAKNAQVPGFRKGMVPAGLIKKMYGQSVFQDEVIKTVENEMNQYIAKEKIEIYMEENLEDKIEDISFNVQKFREYVK